MKHTLSLHALLNGHVTRLRFVKRFNTVLVTHPETVAEHSYYVSLYAMLITRWYNCCTTKQYSGSVADMGTVLQKCLLHDLDECRTGDFPRLFKYSDPVLKIALDHASNTAFREITGELYPDIDGSDMRTSLRVIWEEAKDNEVIEGRIVAFADYLAVLSFMYFENALSNPMMKDNRDSMVKYMLSFDKADFDFLRPLVEEAHAITQEVFGTYRDHKAAVKNVRRLHKHPAGDGTGLGGSSKRSPRAQGKRSSPGLGFPDARHA